MKTSDFYYDLPQELIAQDPLEDRSASRLMLLDKHTGEIQHKVFRDIADLLRPGDCLVINNTKVIPARLFGSRPGHEEKIEVLLLKHREKETSAPKIGDADDIREEQTAADDIQEEKTAIDDIQEEKTAADGIPEENPVEENPAMEDAGKNQQIWETLVRPGKKCKIGTRLTFGNGLLEGEIIDIVDDGNRLIRFSFAGIFEEILDQLGQMPLPPYITHELKDKDRYQTVYAKHDGSAAAPTAGLHFTPELLEKIRQRGVHIAEVTLHVGLGTFRPVKVDDVKEHHMHSEFFQVSEEAAKLVNEAREQGGRIICVGTTSCRTLESAAGEDGRLRACSGWTDIFIYPGFQFRLTDALITNFHLPESTLLMLVSALAGKDHILAAYEEAVRERYRFFSFGDAMFIHPGI